MASSDSDSDSDSSSRRRLPPPSPPVMEPNEDNDDDTYDSSKTSPAVNLSVKERIQMMQRMTDAKKPSPPLMTSGMVQQQQQQQQTSLTSKVGAMETTPRQLTPSFESAEEDDAKTKKTKVKKVVATPLPKYTPYRKEREEEEEKKEEFQTASALIRQRSAPQSVTTTTPAFLSNIPRSPQRSPRSPTFRDRTQMFEQQPVASVSQRQAQMLKNLRLKIQANIEKSEEIALRRKKMNDAFVNLRKVKSKLEQKYAYGGGEGFGNKTTIQTTTQFRKKIISKLVETEFEVETKAIMFNAWKIRTEKEKEKREVVTTKLDAIRAVALRRSFDHWRDVSASLQPRRVALEALELNAKQRHVRDIFNRWRKFAKLSNRAMHVATMKTIDADKKTLSIAFARWELALAKSAKSKAEKKLVRAFVLKKAFVAWRMARDESAFKVEVARRKLRGDDESELVAFVDARKSKAESERMSLYFRSEGSAARKKLERLKGQYYAATNYVTTLLPLATLHSPWDTFAASPTNIDEAAADDDEGRYQRT